MKYLKGTFLLFVVAIAFAAINGKASTTYYVANVEIPWFHGEFSTSEHYKSTTTQQYAKKTGCVDKITGDPRDVEGRTRLESSPYNTTSYVTLSTTEKSLGTNCTEQSRYYRHYVRSVKNLPTPAAYSGNWTIDK